MTDNDEIMKAIAEGDIDALEDYSKFVDDFPTGKDHFIGRNWITNAVDCGTPDVVKWMINKGVSLVFDDDEGYSILQSAIDRERDDKHAVLRMLIEGGADVNAHGMNDWTAAHLAAARNDLESLKMLFEAEAETVTPAEDKQVRNYTTRQTRLLQRTRELGSLLARLADAALAFDRSLGERKLFAVHAVRYLCQSQKDRSSDEMINWILLASARGEANLEIPDYALDKHTAAGQALGRGDQHFWEIGAQLHPELPGRELTYRKRVLDILADIDSQT